MRRAPFQVGVPNIDRNDPVMAHAQGRGAEMCLARSFQRASSQQGFAIDEIYQPLRVRGWRRHRRGEGDGLSSHRGVL